MNADRPRRPRSPSYTPPPSKAEQEKEAVRREAARLGRVAYHQGRKADACPYSEGEALRQLWLNGMEEAGKRTNRPDMSSARATGVRAFQDGLTQSEKTPPFQINTKEAGEWSDGWYQAEAADQKDQQRFR